MNHLCKLKHSEAIETANQMKNSMQHIEEPIEMVGDSLKNWDMGSPLKYSLDPKLYLLYLQSPKSFLAVESSTFAPDYLISRFDL